MENNNILEIKNLKKYFFKKERFFSSKVYTVKAVNDISLNIIRGETLGLVGESGCGKSTAGRLILRLIDPDSGEILVDGKNVNRKMEKTEYMEYRKKVQIIFQDPYASLNPRMTIGDIIAEALIIHKIGTRLDRTERITELLEKVGLKGDILSRYPHEFSGGQRQRIGIARALAVRPELIIADEPVSALDVSVQSQILNLLKELQDSFKLSYLFISHAMSVVEYISDRVAVMYLGKIIEIAKSGEVYNNPLHPYTQALLSAVPIPDPKSRRKRILLRGDIPSPINLPKGCIFAPRCIHCIPECEAAQPELMEYGQDHLAACIRAGKAGKQ